MSGNRAVASGWTRMLAVGLASVLAAGTALAGLGAATALAAAPAITKQPAGQTISEGGTATFAVVASDVETARWQSTTTALANGEPDGSTWVDVPEADQLSLSVQGADANAQHGTFYRAVLGNGSDTVTSQPAQLRFFEKLSTTAAVTVSGESYGPVTPNKPFSVSAPNAVVKGEPIVITGTGYLAPDGTTGSVATFLVDASYSGDPNTLSTTRSVINPVTGLVSTDKRLHAIVQAGADGTWRAEIPWPDHTNTTATEAFFTTNWVEGTHHMVRILTGSTLAGDYQRGISVRFTVVDEPTASEPAATIAATRSTVEQYGDVWFNLSGFEPGAAVTVELANGAGNTVASKPFAIGADGNTANPDGQTYRKLTAPRDAAPGAYVLRVRDGGSGSVLATSEPVTVTVATTRVFNPGDHAGGDEDLLVQRGGVWTFHAVGFAPNGKLTATAQAGGEVLSGPGQISGSEKAWQLDANGDTLREPVFTRVQIPAGVTPGEYAIVFSDGTKTVTRTVVVEAPSQAAVTVGATAELGGTVHVTGEGFVHPNGGGSKIAIKLNEGAYSRVDASLHANRTIWWIVEADEHGNFAIDMPVPNGTEADTGGTLGSVPALVPGGGFTLRFLTGALKPGDQSRTLLSTPFTVTAAAPAPEQPEEPAPSPVVPEPDPVVPVVPVAPVGKALVKTPTPTISGTGKVGKTLKAKTAAWKPSKVKLAYQWLRDGQPIAKATKTKYKLVKADAGHKITIQVTGSKTGYVSVAKVSKAKSVAKVKAKVKLSVPSKVAKGVPATVKVAVTGALPNPTGTVKVTVHGKTVTADLTAAGKGKVQVELPAIAKKGSYKVKASFTPSGDTAVSTSKSSTTTKKLKVR